MKSPSLSTSQPKAARPQNRAEVAKESFFLWEVRDCYVTRHIRTNGRETLQHAQCFCWKSDHVEEEEKEFSNLNEGGGEESRDGPGWGEDRDTEKQDEGQIRCQSWGQQRARKLENPISTALTSTLCQMDIGNLLAWEVIEEGPPAVPGARG